MNCFIVCVLARLLLAAATWFLLSLNSWIQITITILLFAIGVVFLYKYWMDAPGLLAQNNEVWWNRRLHAGYYAVAGILAVAAIITALPGFAYAAGAVIVVDVVIGIVLYVRHYAQATATL
jgi:hypothetical protein